MKLPVQMGILENIAVVSEEYKKRRGLLPIRLCVMGPPASGKSLVASQLCQHYKLHHLKVADVIQQAIEKLVSSGRMKFTFVTTYFKFPKSRHLSVAASPATKQCLPTLDTLLTTLWLPTLVTSSWLFRRSRQVEPGYSGYPSNQPWLKVVTRVGY